MKKKYLLKLTIILTSSILISGCKKENESQFETKKFLYSDEPCSIRRFWFGNIRNYGIKKFITAPDERQGSISLQDKTEVEVSQNWSLNAVSSNDNSVFGIVRNAGIELGMIEIKNDNSSMIVNDCRNSKKQQWKFAGKSFLINGFKIFTGVLINQEDNRLLEPFKEGSEIKIRLGPVYNPKIHNINNIVEEKWEEIADLLWEFGCLSFCEQPGN